MTMAITLSLLGRGDDAIRVLSEVVKVDPSQWRAFAAEAGPSVSPTDPAVPTTTPVPLPTAPPK